MVNIEKCFIKSDVDFTAASVPARECFRSWPQRLVRLLQLKVEVMVVHATRIERRAAAGARILAVQILGN